jgi:TRAP-type mannitol/chloroaromatic compound transport system permease small subunit
MAATDQETAAAASEDSRWQDPAALALRFVAWAIVATTFGFLLNNYLIFWRGWPGFTTLMAHLGLLGAGPLDAALPRVDVALGWLQALSYALCFVVPAVFVLARSARTLRQDGQVMSDIAAYITRAAFWSVFFVGLADMVVSFLRVEGLLEAVVGADLAQELGRSRFRGPYVHFPLIGLALVVAAVSRSLGFAWLALLVVVAEFQIVISRFIFSYEQAFMGDLVRFWYAGLFLFASAYTLVEDGHVRVDVFYAGFTSRTRGIVNAVGSVLLGITLCWVILSIGMWGKSNVLNSPLLNLEVSQSGFGMYVKYLMAGFLAIFAVSMMVQFAGYLLASFADYRGEPGGRPVEDHVVH